MPTLAWKNKRAYVVSSRQIDGVRKYKWTPLGCFDKRLDGIKKFEEWLVFNDHTRIEKQIMFEDFINKYLEYVKANKAETNYLHQKNHANTLIRHFKHLRLSDINSLIIEEFKLKNDWKPTTWRNRLGFLRQALKYAKIHGFTVQDPFQTIKVPSPKLYDFNPKLTTHEIMDEIMDKMDAKTRDICTILRYTGIRPSELFRLKKEDILPDKIRVISKKVKRTRYVPIHKKIGESLNGVPFHMNWNTFQHRIQKACKDAGHSKALSAYTFRHQFSSDIVNKTGNIRAAQQLLGHATIQMTTRYAHVTDQNLRDIINVV